MSTHATISTFADLAVETLSAIEAGNVGQTYIKLIAAQHKLMLARTTIEIDHRDDVIEAQKAPRRAVPARPPVAAIFAEIDQPADRGQDLARELAREYVANPPFLSTPKFTRGTAGALAAGGTIS